MFTLLRLTSRWLWYFRGKKLCRQFLFHLAASLFSFRSLWCIALLEGGSDYFVIKNIQMPEHAFSSGSMAMAKRAPDSFGTCVKCGISSNCDEVWGFYGKIKSIMADTVYCPYNNHLPAPRFLQMYSQFSSQRFIDSRQGVFFLQPRGLIMIGLGLSIEPCFSQ